MTYQQKGNSTLNPLTLSMHGYGTDNDWLFCFTLCNIHNLIFTSCEILSQKHRQAKNICTHVDVDSKTVSKCKQKLQVAEGFSYDPNCNLYEFPI